ncbi:hypothetical protein WJX73_010718 [Symbiochloris irregularis]|uniref:C2 domain-containing protein n=1 Tax=Symbiochloris irregularis TaxID=706552 RepID=A0AAW1NY43_9CHLO
MATPARGQLLLKIIDASGEGKDKGNLWESNFSQGFVKVEIRGGSRTVKAQSTQKRVEGTALRWDEDLSLNVLEDAKELRLMLCRERKSQSTGKISAVVMAACGIYVREILENVPIDKHFELFKPQSGAAGGSIHIHAEYRLSETPENGHHNYGGLATVPSGYISDEVGSPATPAGTSRTRFADSEPVHESEAEGVGAEAGAGAGAGAGSGADTNGEGGGRRKGRFPFKLLLLAGLASAAGFAAKAAAQKR